MYKDGGIKRAKRHVEHITKARENHAQTLRKPPQHLRLIILLKILICLPLRNLFFRPRARRDVRAHARIGEEPGARAAMRSVRCRLRDDRPSADAREGKRPRLVCARDPRILAYICRGSCGCVPRRVPRTLFPLFRDAYPPGARPPMTRARGERGSARARRLADFMR